MANIAVNADEYKAVATQGRNFTGKVAMVTGSGSGTGASIVKLLSALGAHVVVTGRDETLIHNVAKECQQMSPKNLKPLVVVANIINTGDLKTLIATTITTFGRLDVLVNAETIAPFTDIWDTNLVKHFDETIAVDVRAILELTQLAVPHLEATKGTVINMSSISGIAPAEFSIPYTVAKAALDMLSRVLAIHLGPKGVRVNTVNPGIVQHAGQINKYTELTERIAPLKRNSEPLDVAKAVAFLASTDARNITGINLVVDGGVIFNNGYFNAEGYLTL